MLRACIFTLLCLIIANLAFGSDARAERRVALVVGNAAYVHAPTLRNPRNDASDMAAALRKEGFQVILGLDLDQEHFADMIQRFARLLDDADVALFYYAGHGLQIDGKNYLVSVNARLNNEFLIPSETIGLNAIVRLMESKVPVDLIFLDACRDDPLADNLRKNLIAMQRGGEIGRGLARIEPTGRDTLIAFAAAPGQEAADGKGRNSPFTAALLKYISRPNLEVSVMLKLVAADVREKTNNSQRPQQLSDMSRTFYFVKPGTEVASTTPSAASGKAPTPPTMPRNAAPNSSTDAMVEVAFWNSVQNAHSCDAVRAYMQRFPDGIFIALAKQAERRLCFSTQDRHVTIVQSAPNANNGPQSQAPPAASQPQPSSPQPPQQIQQGLNNASPSSQVGTAKTDLTSPPPAPTLTSPAAATKAVESPPPTANAFTNLPPPAAFSTTEHQVAQAPGLMHSPPVPTLTPPAAAPKAVQSPQPAANAPTPPATALTPPAAAPKTVQSLQPTTNTSTNPSAPQASSTMPAPATSISKGTTKIAALPRPEAPGGQPAKEVGQDVIDADIARDLQRELARVGCPVGRIDGKWGPRSRAALRKFDHYAGLDLDAEIPSQSAIDAVRKRHGYICPEASERPERAERSHRPAHSARKSEEFSRLAGKRQTRKRDWRSISPLCQSAYYEGSRLCCTYDAEGQPPVIICP